MCVDEIVVAFHGNTPVVVFGVVVRLVADAHSQLFFCHSVSFVVFVKEIEIQIAKFAQFGMWVIGGDMCAFQYKRLDAMFLQCIHDVVLYISLVACPICCLVAFRQPGDEHRTWWQHLFGHLVKDLTDKRGDVVALQETEEAPPILGRHRDIKTTSRIASLK